MEVRDLMVIGAGPAGRAAAIIARREGSSVIVVEENGFGGVCPLRGCVPKKMLVAAAETLDVLARAPRHEIDAGSVSLDWSRLIARKREELATTSTDTELQLKDHGIETISGHARFSGPDTVRVGDAEYRAQQFVVACGARPRRLDIPGFEHLLSSDEFLELDTRPASAVFLGAGPVSMEFAHVLVRTGTQVTVVEASSRLLPMHDSDLTAALADESRNMGMTIHTQAHVEAVDQAGQGGSVVFAVGGRHNTVNAEVVVNGTGRVSNLDDLGLDEAGVEYDKSGILTDSFLRSISNPRVFVAGDVLGTSPRLSPVATYEGKLVGYNLTHKNLRIPDYRFIPQAVHTIPSLASVGLTEDQARLQGIDYTVRSHDMRDWRSSRTYHERTCLAKILLDEDYHILGVHLLGHRGEELINLFAFAMHFDITARQLFEMVYAFPTFSADIREMLR